MLWAENFVKKSLPLNLITIALSFIFSRLSERRRSDKAWGRRNFKGVNKQTRWTIQLAQVISQLFCYIKKNICFILSHHYTITSLSPLQIPDNVFRIEVFVICWLICVLGLLSWYLTNAILLLLRSRKPSDNPAIVKLYKWVSSMDVVWNSWMRLNQVSFLKFLPELYFPLELKSTLKWPSLMCLITLINFVCLC